MIDAVVGGLLIGLSAVALMATLGRIAGISGIAAGALTQADGDRTWRLAFVLGLIAAPLLRLAITGTSGIGSAVAGPPLMAVAGLLVGLGTRWGSGCTSGHGVCGLARFSRRSLVATGVFMFTAMATVALVRHAGGVT